MMSVIERREMATGMLLHCGMAEHFWKEVTLYAVETNSRVPPAKANWAGLRQSPLERGDMLLSVHGKAHKCRSEQIM